MFCWTRDITVRKSAWMTSAQLWSRRHHWPWADVIRADFQTVISCYLHNVNTRLFCTADRVFRTIIMQNSRLIYAFFPIKNDEVWIDQFCVRYDWWRRLQPTSSVSPVWYILPERCAIISAISHIRDEIKQTKSILNRVRKFPIRKILINMLYPISTSFGL